jgi:hypothetical protein
MVPATVPRADARVVRAVALLCGAAGVAATVLVVLFFLFDYPYSPFGAGWSWPGPASDVATAVQFALLAPVVWALHRHVPPTTAVRATTWAAVGACVAVALLQTALVAGLLTFAQEIGPAMACFLVVYGWLLTVSLAAHRSRALPRPVTRAGAVLGGAMPVATVLVGAGYLIPGPVGRLAFWTGFLVGMLGWLGLAAYPLLLARHVFTEEP